MQRTTEEMNAEAARLQAMMLAALALYKSDFEDRTINKKEEVRKFEINPELHPGVIHPENVLVENNLSRILGTCYLYETDKPFTADTVRNAASLISWLRKNCSNLAETDNPFSKFLSASESIIIDMKRKINLSSLEKGKWDNITEVKAAVEEKKRTAAPTTPPADASGSNKESKLPAAPSPAADPNAVYVSAAFASVAPGSFAHTQGAQDLLIKLVEAIKPTTIGPSIDGAPPTIKLDHFLREVVNESIKRDELIHLMREAIKDLSEKQSSFKQHEKDSLEVAKTYLERIVNKRDAGPIIAEFLRDFFSIIPSPEKQTNRVVERIFESLNPNMQRIHTNMQGFVRFNGRILIAKILAEKIDPTDPTPALVVTAAPSARESKLPAAPAASSASPARETITAVPVAAASPAGERKSVSTATSAPPATETKHAAIAADSPIKILDEVKRIVKTIITFETDYYKRGGGANSGQLTKIINSNSFMALEKLAGYKRTAKPKKLLKGDLSIFLLGDPSEPKAQKQLLANLYASIIEPIQAQINDLSTPKLGFGIGMFRMKDRPGMEPKVAMEQFIKMLNDTRESDQNKFYRGLARIICTSCKESDFYKTYEEQFKKLDQIEAPHP